MNEKSVIKDALYTI